MNDKTSTLTAIPELLAPAGDAVCLRAAVRGGANAVYLGMGDFNARRGAENFTAETLARACRYAHLRGVKIYLTLNTIVLPDEVDDALETAKAAADAGVDAFIVQDIGLAAHLVRQFPQVALHISTQMNTLNADGIRAAAALGAKRITLGRELTLAEIQTCAQAAAEYDMQVEVFAHGALCVCYSGQCFFSSMVGGRSANRGMCAQACRLPYELHVQGQDAALPSDGEHLLSPKDLCTIDMLEDLMRAGAASLKIEGRMKSPEYVYAVVSTYRAVLDRLAAAGQSSHVQATEQERQRLQEVFSRGFTTAYLHGERGNDMMSYQRPNNRGVLLGRVSQVRDGYLEFVPDKPLVVGDVIEVWTGKGRAALTVADVKGSKTGVRIPLDDGNRDQRAIRTGDRVFRVRSAEAAFVDDIYEPRIGVCGEVIVRKGEPLVVRFWRAEDESKAVCGEAFGQVVEAARTKELIEEDVREHIGRFGNTPFALEQLDVRLDAGCGMGFSALHKARAQALEALEGVLVSSKELCETDSSDSPSGTEDCLSARREFRRCWAEDELSERRALLQEDAKAPAIVALATNPACARAAKRAGADVVYVPVLNYKRGLSVLAGIAQEDADQAGYPKHCVPLLPVVNRPSLRPLPQNADFDVWDYVSSGEPAMVDNWGDVYRASVEGVLAEVGPHVPVANALALETMAHLGVRSVWLSPELTLEQIRTLMKSKPELTVGITVFGRAELMVCEHCMLMSQGPCAQNCDTCLRRQKRHVLKDRKGYEFPVLTDVCGRSHVYNSVALDTTHVIPELLECGLTRFMVDTTLLDAEQTAQAVGRAVKALAAAQAGESLPKASGYTTGHLFRGVS